MTRDHRVQNHEDEQRDHEEYDDGEQDEGDRPERVCNRVAGRNVRAVLHLFFFVGGHQQHRAVEQTVSLFNNRFTMFRLF